MPGLIFVLNGTLSQMFRELARRRFAKPLHTVNR